MTFLSFYITGVVTGVVLARLMGVFHWSVVDEPPQMVLDKNWIILRKILIWILIWAALFGTGIYID